MRALPEKKEDFTLPNTVALSQPLSMSASTYIQTPSDDAGEQFKRYDTQNLGIWLQRFHYEKL